MPGRKVPGYTKLAPALTKLGCHDGALRRSGSYETAG